MSGFSYRSPYASIKDEPIARDQVHEFRDSLVKFWEDTWLVTEPNAHRVILVGTLLALCDTLLACKDFDNPQIMMGAS